MSPERELRPAPHGGQNRLERGLERLLLFVLRGLVSLTFAAVAYVFLTVSALVCCSVETFPWMDPRSSPWGPVVTVFVVWPVMGGVCLAFQAVIEHFFFNGEEPCRRAAPQPDNHDAKVSRWLGFDRGPDKPS